MIINKRFKPIKTRCQPSSRKLSGLLLASCFCFLFLSNCWSEEYTKSTAESASVSTVTFGSEVDFTSRYLWHGIPYSEGAVAQPSVWISAYDFTFTLWSNFVLNNEPNHGQCNEVDYSLSYSKEWNKLTIEPSFNYYCYPNQVDSPATGELALKLSYPLGPVEISTNQSVDVVHYRGAYFGEFGVGYTHTFNPKLSLETKIIMGWGSSKFNETYLGLSKNAVNYTQAELALNYKVNRFIYLRPHIALSSILDNELREQVDDPTIFYGGLVIGFTTESGESEN